MWYTNIIEKGIIPDSLIRVKIRSLLKQRLREERENYNLPELIKELKNSPIAIETKAANDQHYELPASFFESVLGKYLKYSCGYWDESIENLNQAEKRMLELSVERAELRDGQDILELGCGWGSLSIFMANKFPNSRITVVSNSNSQREFINSHALKSGITNLKVITADMNDFTSDQLFDRVVSVEMFEHMRNYQELLYRIDNFLKPAGKLFVHIFSHTKLTYKFEVKDSSDWMSKYFFTGGIMPGEQLFDHFQDHLSIEQRWHMNGVHYQKTAEAWLKRMDSNKNEILSIFESTYGHSEAKKWWVYWRIFFMACAELWGFKQGKEWSISHYLFSKRNPN
ncbi:SAM-dependent methyltransferase [Marinifilum caeruleilacunae]|nr:class I SAM-dependent methyltransferase [Marinifilum caeruleilacunae]